MSELEKQKLQKTVEEEKTVENQVKEEEKQEKVENIEKQEKQETKNPLNMEKAKKAEQIKFHKFLLGSSINKRVRAPLSNHSIKQNYVPKKDFSKKRDQNFKFSQHMARKQRFGLFSYTSSSIGKNRLKRRKIQRFYGNDNDHESGRKVKKQSWYYKFGKKAKPFKAGIQDTRHNKKQNFSYMPPLTKAIINQVNPNKSRADRYKSPATQHTRSYLRCGKAIAQRGWRRAQHEGNKWRSGNSFVDPKIYTVKQNTGLHHFERQRPPKQIKNLTSPKHTRRIKNLNTQNTVKLTNRQMLVNNPKSGHHNILINNGPNILNNNGGDIYFDKQNLHSKEKYFEPEHTRQMNMRDKEDKIKKFHQGSEDPRWRINKQNKPFWDNKSIYNDILIEKIPNKWMNDNRLLNDRKLIVVPHIYDNENKKPFQLGFNGEKFKKKPIGNESVLEYIPDPQPEHEKKIAIALHQQFVENDHGQEFIPAFYPMQSGPYPSVIKLPKNQRRMVMKMGTLNSSF